jgi:putative ABC transport system ATP-binding protein
MEMIELASVKKSYRPGGTVIRALDAISLSVAKGEFVVITGPSGSGKTTLLNLIGGMTRPDGGAVKVAGEDLLALSDARLSRFRAETIGFIFQFPSLLPTLTARDNVLLPLTFSRRRDQAVRPEALLQEVGLGDRLDAFAHQLSAGQQRRVGIARALINEPALLLCDEPTGDLDPEAEAVIMRRLAAAHERGATVLLVTHNHALRSFATRTVSIAQGKIVEG